MNWKQKLIKWLGKTLDQEVHFNLPIHQVGTVEVFYERYVLNEHHLNVMVDDSKFQNEEEKRRYIINILTNQFYNQLAPIPYWTFDEYFKLEQKPFSIEKTSQYRFIFYTKRKIN